MTSAQGHLGRRGLLALGAGGIAAATLPPPARARERTSARIVIAGAGAAGITMAARLSQRLDGARITVIDRRERHVYQPGLTLVGAGVWTRDGNRAYRMGRGIQAGRVWTNCYHAYPAHAAFGGYKQSGWGRENGAEVLDLYTEVKTVVVPL